MKTTRFIKTLFLLLVSSVTLMSQEHPTKYSISYYLYSRDVRNTLINCYRSEDKPMVFTFDDTNVRFEKNDSIFRAIYHSMNEVKENKKNVYLIECDVNLDSVFTERDILTKDSLDFSVFSLMYRIKASGTRNNRLKFTSTAFFRPRVKKDYKVKLTITKLSVTYENFEDKYSMDITTNNSWMLYSIDHNGKVVTDRSLGTIIIDREPKTYRQKWESRKEK